MLWIALHLVASLALLLAVKADAMLHNNVCYIVRHYLSLQ